MSAMSRRILFEDDELLIRYAGLDVDDREAFADRVRDRT
jgi:hypothetical protein